MTQQLIALIVIMAFIFRLIRQRRKNQLGRNELNFWLAFWIMGAIAVIFIRQIDRFVGWLGFSSGINFLLYLAVISLFYLIFKLRLTVAKLDANLTAIARELALREGEKKD